MPKPKVGISKHQWEVRTWGLKTWKYQIICQRKIRLDWTEEKNMYRYQGKGGKHVRGKRELNQT